MKKLIALSLLLAAARASPAGQAGADPFNFLFLDVGARAVALGGACTALSGGANALAYNPAGLAGPGGHSAVFMHNQYVQGVTQEYLSYASPSGYGLSLNYLDFGTMRRTTLSNPTGAGLGQVGLTDIALSAGYGARLAGGLTGGVGLKLVRENIAWVTGDGAALDAGLLYSPRFLPKARFGAALQNLGPKVKFQGREEALPLNLRAGAAYKLGYGENTAILSADVGRVSGGKAVAAFGAELLTGGSVAVRLGYNEHNSAGTGLTFGLGYSARGLDFDYAFVPFGALGSAHRLSVGFSWGGSAAQAAAGPVKNPFDYEKFLDEAAVLSNAKRYAESERALAGALALMPEDDWRRAFVCERRGDALLKLNRPGEAKPHFELSLKLMQEGAPSGTVLENAYYGLARCLDAEGQVKEAVLNYKKALKLTRNEALKQKIQVRLAGT